MSFKGFMTAGFDLSTNSGRLGTLKQVLVDVGANATGTAVGCTTPAQQNQKQGMNCRFNIQAAGESTEEDVTCKTYAIGFASEGGHGGYATTVFQNPLTGSAFEYFSSAPTNTYILTPAQVVPILTFGVEFKGLFTALKMFTLNYTGAPPATGMIAAACANTNLNTFNQPNTGSSTVYGLIRQPSSGYPKNDFKGRVECFGNWAQVGP